jgi:hypothetical protein
MRVRPGEGPSARKIIPQLAVSYERERLLGANRPYHYQNGNLDVGHWREGI